MPPLHRRGPSTTLLLPFLLLSVTQWAGGFACWVQALLDPTVWPGRLELGPALVAASLGLSGIFLAVGQRDDLRAMLLGAVFLFSASAFAVAPLIALGRSGHPMAGVAAGLTAFPVEALVPFCLWRFAALFPRALDPPPSRWALRIGTGVSLAAGLALIGANALMAVTEVPVLEAFDHRDPYSTFPYFLAGLSLLPLPVIAYRLRNASTRDRTRARLLAVPLLLLAGLLGLLLLAQVAAEHGSDGRAPSWIGWFLVPFTGASMAVPPALAFAITTRRALHVRFLAPRLFLRAVTTGLAVLACVGALVLVLSVIGGLDGGWRHPRAPALATAFLLLAAVAAWARWTARPRRGSDLDDWSGWTAETTTVDRVADFEAWLEGGASLLGARSLEILPLSTWRTRAKVLPPGPEAPVELGQLFAVREDAIDLETVDPLGEAQALPGDVRRWLGERGAVVLQPVRSSSGELLAILSVGERLDQATWDRSSRARIRAVAALVALILKRDDGPATGSPAEDEAAAECPRCARIYAGLVDRCPGCGSSTELLEEPLLVAGKYQLEVALGRGSLGRVYRARDVVLDRPVAVKALLQASPEALRTLSREARAMARLRHPRLATVHGAERTTTGLYLITELLEGGTLDERPRPLPWTDAVSLLLELLEALRPLHDLDIVHGDLKPSNVGFDREGRLKLLDFGMTRLVGDSFAPRTPESDDLATSMVLPGGHVGTPLYAPPEAWRGEPVGIAADLWPSAVLLFELVGGRHPFEDGGTGPGRADRTRRAIEDGRLPSLSDLCDCPRRLATLLERALHLDPARRFADGASMERALREVLAEPA